ncbi:hypothetical protein Sste5346_001575 [Sporothrix stenoceras]|uniref:Integral membrane channel protein n=1 Tax=Sporothrix stenoceras TaxID=5173 RepID=A0ABR3ZP49_9PEZI
MFSMLLRAVHGNKRPTANQLLSDMDAAEADPDPDMRTFPRMVLEEEDDDQEQAGPAHHHNRSAYSHLRHATADFTEADDDEDEDDSNDGRGHNHNHGHNHGPRGLGHHTPSEDGDRRSSQLLPLFSASHLDALPVYSIVHAMRIIVQARTETTLTWEQLRSPQVSQFLVKPMQQQIRAQHFSRATLYALMANCLQFAKEAQFYPGNAGTSNTRAKVCELLAIKLLKEYTTRELIDALSYDFNPLQGLPGASLSPQHAAAASSGGLSAARPGSAPAARISTLEVAIRASAKHFLAHPLVVQHLEAIWNGAISFYSSADQLHRNNGKAPAVSHSRQQRRDAPRGVGIGRRSSDQRTPLLGGHQPIKEEPARNTLPAPPALYRRTVTLYDPRNASLFKLSRLRVPRYRQFLSTCSLAILIGLFLAVLVQHSSRITTLELVFWFWSAGFMLDELVGFNEQGFSLYIMSFWNIFDLGILLLLIFYYSLRICGVFLADAQRWNNSAYDILAANAILLLPRIFSVLDHYQYFSQLLIAFRLMAVDLAAVFILILVSCSGFFVFFTLSHTENEPTDVAYMIFQLLMGFTPAAWEVWPTYNILGKTLLVLFLIICHFVVVTILITVLTNSFMAIASNANEEHQFLFAINTISMVKNDALFSYVAPTNIFAWMLMPLRYCMPLSHFVALNRLIIKATHFPLLFSIFVYEKFFLAPFMYEPTDLVENHTRSRHRGISLADPGSRPVLFSPSIRLREESVVGFQKDRALDEVFRRTPDIATLRTQRRNERRKTQTAIRNWMDQHDGTGYSTIDNKRGGGPGGVGGGGGPDHEWQRRMSINHFGSGRERGGSNSQRFRHMSEVRSTASDPADLMSLSAMPGLTRDVRMFGMHPYPQRSPFEAAFKDHTDAEGDDELVTNDDDEEDEVTNTGGHGLTPLHSREDMLSRQSGRDGDNDDDGEIREGEDDDDDDGGDFFATPVASRFLNVAARSPESSKAVEEDEEGNEGEPVGSSAASPRRIGNISHITNATSPPKQTTRRALHSRALSSNTILYNPPNPDVEGDNDSSDAILGLRQSPGGLFFPPSPKHGHHQQSSSRSRPLSSRHNTPAAVPGTPTTAGQRSPRKSNQGGGLPGISTTSGTRPRPIMLPREPTTQSSAASRAAAIFNTAAMIDSPVRRIHQQRRLSSFDMGSDDAGVSASGLLTESAVGPPLGAPDVVLPGSFTSQLALATAMNNARATANLALAGETDRDRDRMSRLVLARMKTLEESFTDVVHELRSLQKQQQQALASGRTSAVVSGRASAVVSSSEGESGQEKPQQDKPRVPPLSRMPTVLVPSAPTTAATSQTGGTGTNTGAGSNTPKSPTGSRIPISATLSNLGMSSPPGPGGSQLPRVASSGVIRQIPRPSGGASGAGDNSNEASESPGQSQSRVPRRAKGKGVERRATVASDDDDGESFY